MLNFSPKIRLGMLINVMLEKKTCRQISFTINLDLRRISAKLHAILIWNVSL